MKEKNAQHIAGQIGRICFYEDLLTQAEQALAGEPSSESTAPEEADLAEKIRKLDLSHIRASGCAGQRVRTVR